jgi:hypothetical protein
MKIGMLLLFLFLFTTSKSFGQTDTLKVCFTGDVMLDRNVEQKINAQGFSYLSNPLNLVLCEYPYRVINLECPITTAVNPIDKKYNFKVDTSFIELLKMAGVTHAGIANNHINDQKQGGAIETINGLSEGGIVPFGYNQNNEKKCEPVEIIHNGIKISLFAAMQLGVSDEESKNICSCYQEDLLQQINRYKIRNQGTTVVCYLHWGIEYYHTPTESQKELAHHLIENGADIVIGHHPHVVQTIEFYHHKPIFYSLGNLVFDQQQPDTKEGLVLGVSVNGNKLNYKIIPYAIVDFCPKAMNGSEFDEMKQRLLHYSNGIELKQADNGWLVSESNSMQLGDENYLLKICDANFCGDVSLEKLKELEGYRLKIEDTINGRHDELHLKYPVYRFECADINSDGNTDILAGVVKSTHFEPELDRRLFIFRIDSTQIRPLWLGSKLCFQLVDFRCVNDDNKSYIISLEKTDKELYCIGKYKWQNFGLQLIAYHYSDLDYKTALTRFEHEE